MGLWSIREDGHCRKGQRAATMMVGEVNRRKTSDAVKRFRLELRDAAESYLRQEEGVRGPSIGSWKLPKCEESPNRLSVNKMRGGRGRVTGSLNRMA